MKKLLLMFAGIAVLTFSACKKDDDDDTNGTCSGGKNLCMLIDGTQFSENAEWREIPNRYRVYWETGSGNNYKNIELDIYGTATGDYAISNSATTGQAAFQYYVNDNGTVTTVYGESGTVKVTSLAGDKMTGTFSVVGKDQNNNTVNFTEGKFFELPKN